MVCFEFEDKSSLIIGRIKLEKVWFTEERKDSIEGRQGIEQERYQTITIERKNFEEAKDTELYKLYNTNIHEKIEMMRKEKQ